jgi:Domain of unknown function (DUF4439)
MNQLMALQAALAAEDATIYGYGVAGAFLQDPDRTYAANAITAHQLVRDKLAALIQAGGVAPVAAQPAYQLPFVVNGPKTAAALAAHLEQGEAGASWDLVATSAASSALRTLAVGWLTAAALRATHWGERQALPGQPA